MMHSTYSARLLACNKAGRGVHASNLRSIVEYRKQLFSRFTRTTANRETVAHKFLARLAGLAKRERGIRLATERLTRSRAHVGSILSYVY